MRVLILCMLVVAASAKPTAVSHAIEVGTNGVIGSTIASPLVSLLININKGMENLVSIDGVPEATPVIESPAPVVLPSPAIPEVIVPAPAPVVLPAPAVPGVIAPAPAPVVLPTPAVPGVIAPAPAPVVLPAPAVPGVVAPAPAPVVLPAPAVPDVITPVSPVIVVPGLEIDSPAPEPVNVVDEVVQPVIVVDNANTPASVAESERPTGVTNNYFINVLLNFISGQDGSTSVSSSSLSSFTDSLQQMLGSQTPRI